MYRKASPLCTELRDEMHQWQAVVNKTQNITLIQSFVKRKFHDYLTCTACVMTIQLVERRHGVPEGASSNPVRMNSFSVDVSCVR